MPSSATAGIVPVPFSAMAVPMLSLVTLGLRGQFLPTDSSSSTWLWPWLSISGLIGFVFGDMCLFRAFMLIGPRLSSLIMATAPLMTAIIGFFVLGEGLGVLALTGMALTIGGVAWALADRQARPPAQAGHRRLGILLALGGALGQAGGLVLSKYGMGDYDAFAATQVRVIAGGVGYALLFFVLGWWPNVRAGIRDAKALGFAALGAFFGPFLAVTLSLIAIRETVAGVAASIMALTPVLIIPLVVVFKKERVGLGGLAGALVAVTGVALLFL